jgi:hypothetical protein
MFLCSGSGGAKQFRTDPHKHCWAQRRVVLRVDGLFSLQTPTDLLQKLESDFLRLREASPAGLEAQYAAFDFFVTAEHLADWVSACTGESLASLRSYPEGLAVSHVANGAKHFRVDPARHAAVTETRSAGIFDPAIFDPAIFDVGRLVLDLEGGSTVNVLDLAGRVLDHWRRLLSADGTLPCAQQALPADSGSR